MKFFYISSKNGLSGICKYSREFFDLVLEPKGFIFIDSSEDLSTIFTRVSSRDYVHFEIGVFQKREIEILIYMLKAGYRNISITLHDPPLLKYPYFDFSNRFLNILSKAYDRFLTGHINSAYIIRKIKAIFVLTHAGVAVTNQIYGVDNVYYLPHVVDCSNISTEKNNTPNFLYFGFIGKNKGIEYSLRVHESIIADFPGIQFYVVGTAIGSQMRYYNYLKKRFVKNVHFLGYLDEDQLAEVFGKSTFAMLLFNHYNYFYPASGSILRSLRMGKIVVTNNVNAVGEIINNGENGIFLSGNFKQDINYLKELIGETQSLKTIQRNATRYLMTSHSPELVSKLFFDVIQRLTVKDGVVSFAK